MSEKWNNIWIAAGGIASVLFITGYFGIDAILKQAIHGMETHYILLLVGLLVSLVVFASSLYVKFRKITPRNVQTKIRQWLDTFNISHRVMTWEHWHFRIDVTFYGWIIFVGRPKDMAGRYLTIQIRGQGIPNEYREAFGKLTNEEKSVFYSRLTVETTWARMVVNASNDLTDIVISRHIPITSTLTESEFIDGLNEVYRATIVLWNSIALRLSENPKLMRPLSTPNTGASPQLPAS